MGISSILHILKSSHGKNFCMFRLGNLLSHSWMYCLESCHQPYNVELLQGNKSTVFQYKSMVYILSFWTVLEYIYLCMYMYYFLRGNNRFMYLICSFLMWWTCILWSWLLWWITAGMRGLRYVVQNLLQIRNRVHCSTINNQVRWTSRSIIKKTLGNGPVSN